MQELNNFIYIQKKLEYLFGNLLNSVFGNLAIVIIVFYTLQNVVENTYLNIWFSLHILITLLRTLLLYFYKKDKIDKKNMDRYYILFFSGAFFSGLLWGAGAFLIFPQESEYQMFLILMISGLVSGSAVSFASRSEIFYSYFFVTMVPYLYALSTAQNTISSAIFMAIIFYLIFLSLIERKISKNVENNILLAFQNKELVSQLKQKVEELSRASEAKSTFLSVMSHEIRTPMNAIIGFIKILIQGEKDELKLKYLNTIDKSSYILLGVLNDILDISKIESGKFILQKIAFNPKEEFESVYELFKQISKEKNINLINSISKELPRYINSDKLRLKQIISNLLSNAVKFTPQNKNIELIIKYDEDKSSLYVEVKDEGLGIAKENIDKILEEFTQVDDSTNRQYTGTGLGLAIANKFLYLFNSELHVESELNVGSSFSFEIYVEMTELIDEEENYELHDIDFNAKKVLLAEDSKTNQMLIEILLTNMNMEVTIANNGVEAEELFRKNDFEIVLMDINMPNKNGIEAMHTIREYEKKSESKTPIIALTANAVSGDREKYIKEGFDDYVPKPIDNERLVQVLQRHLSK
ncbi:MAG: response regulator [Sulfurimonas sp.]|nr:response regulator [Sulfurimonas sp.]